MQQYQMYIDGSFVDSSNHHWFETQNPYTGKAWAEVARGTEADVDRAVKAADRAFRTGPWAEMTATQRGALLRNLGDLIAKNSDRLAEFEVQDNGKLFAEMSAQLRYLPQWFYYFGGLADKSKVQSFRWIRRATSTTHAVNRWASLPRLRRGTLR